MGEEHNQQNEGQAVLTGMEIDTIGEILNISMGSAATAISTMLDKQVVISTPTVEVRKFDSLDYAALEPAMMVKINYVEGISGSNVMIFRQRDMQVILNLLMGNDEPPTEDFVFDELSMSAACEVMNQMMGSSATALSEFLGRAINISTPEASIVDAENSYRDAMDVMEGDEIVAVSFKLSIADVMDSSFASILTCGLAKEIVTQVLGEQEMEEVPPAPPAAAAPPPAAARDPSGQPPQAPPLSAPQPAPPPQQMPQQPAPPQMPTPGGYPEAPLYGQPAYPPYGYGYGYPAPYPQMGYGTPGQSAAAPAAAGMDAGFAAPPPGVIRQSVNVQETQFPQFTMQQSEAPNPNGNMDLLMGVSLDVSVEIGKAKRKIREIIEFGQGTVIELNKQAGAPVDIVVNGRLLARGDVVVIDDNFGVRITEILGTKELMESLKEEAL